MVQLQTSQATIYSMYKRVVNPDGDIDMGEKIEVSSDFQRGDEETGVWKLDAKRDYINSLECNYPTGLISVVKPHINGGSKPYKVLDGGNRVRTIRDFMNNKFTVDGLYFSDEPNIGIRRQESLKHTCIAFQTITIERDDPPTTISEMFTRLNTSSVPLRPGELIKSHGWLKNKPMIELAKYFIGDVWDNDETNNTLINLFGTDTGRVMSIIVLIRTEWVKVFCGGNPSKLKEGKRCDSMAMICAFMVSSITGEFKNFDKRYDSIHEHLDSEINVSHVKLIANKLLSFLDIMKDVFNQDIFSTVTNGIPSRKMVAPVWFKICDGSMTTEFQDKMKKFFRAMVDDKQLKHDYFGLRDGGSNGETALVKMKNIVNFIEAWEE